MVRIAASQAVDPGSIPGHRILLSKSYQFKFFSLLQIDDSQELLSSNVVSFLNKTIDWLFKKNTFHLLLNQVTLKLAQFKDNWLDVETI